jgi:hypothetical protein
VSGFAMVATQTATPVLLLSSNSMASGASIRAAADRWFRLGAAASTRAPARRPSRQPGRDDSGRSFPRKSGAAAVTWHRRELSWRPVPGPDTTSPLPPGAPCCRMNSVIDRGSGSRAGSGVGSRRWRVLTVRSSRVEVVSADGLVHASEAYQLAGNQIQDAVSAGGAWYLSCTYRRERPGELIAATPDASPAGTLRATATRPAGIGRGTCRTRPPTAGCGR